MNVIIFIVRWKFDIAHLNDIVILFQPFKKVN